MALLTISVRQLRAGDSILISAPAAPYTGVIQIVSTVPNLLQAQDSSAVISNSEEWIVAVENLTY